MDAVKKLKSLTAKERLKLVVSGLADLKAVEKIIQTKLPSEAALLTEISEYLFSLGGKRIRPILTLLAGRAFGQERPSQSVLDVAAGIELIHMATLLHDDIIDKSPLRRHQESAYSRFGIANTLLSGDFLLIRAFSLCAKLDTFIIDATEDACIALTEGEILELPLYDHNHTLESSLDIAAKKTAALFELAAVSGAHLAGASKEASASMAMFGRDLGIAFQTIDDVLDVISDEDILGKKSGSDLIERKPSIVNVLWLQSDSAISKRLKQKPGAASEENEFVEQALVELRGSDTIEKAKALAISYAESARGHLNKALSLSPSSSTEAKTALSDLVDFAVERLS